MKVVIRHRSSIVGSVFILIHYRHCAAKSGKASPVIESKSSRSSDIIMVKMNEISYCTKFGKFGDRKGRTLLSATTDY